MLFANVGARLAPLSSLDEIAGFFLAASSNASHAPSRASIIAQWLGASLTDVACMLLPMLKTLSSMRAEAAAQVADRTWSHARLCP